MDLIDCWGSHFYGVFLRQNGAVETNGMWTFNQCLYLVVKDTSATALGGSPLQEWVDAHRPIGVQIKVVDGAPLGARRIAERSVADHINDFGAPRPLWRLQHDLEVDLGPDFPSFSAGDGVAPGTINVETCGVL